MLLCYVIDSGLSTSLLLLATLIIMFYIYIYIMCATDGQTDGRTDGQKQRLLPPSVRSGHNNRYRIMCSNGIKLTWMNDVDWHIALQCVRCMASHLTLTHLPVDCGGVITDHC